MKKNSSLSKRIMSERLYKEGAISIKQFEDKEREFLTKKASFEGIQLNIVNSNIQLSELNQRLDKLIFQNREQYELIESACIASFKALKSALASWEQNYLLRAPTNGKVAFFKYWSNNQFVKAGEEVMIIVPEIKQQVIGKVFMPLQNSGKVKTGQRVNIQLDSYPHQEYGMVTGEVTSISLVPRENVYLIEVHLPNGLHTTYKKDLTFMQEMQGQAEIITEDLRLLERIFYQIRKIFKQQ